MSTPLTPAARSIAATRTANIVARVQRELWAWLQTNQHDALARARHDLIVGRTLTEVEQYAVSLTQQASMVSVSRQIIAATALTLGQLGYPIERVPDLAQFMTDIDTLAHS